MSNKITTIETDSFVLTKINDTNSITIEIKEGTNSFLELLKILKDNPGCNITIYNIYSYKVFNLLVALFSREEYDGTVTFNLRDSENNMDDLEKQEFLDLFNIPSYIKIRGFIQNNEQNSFSTWAHNLGNSFKEELVKHLEDSDRNLFEGQEEVINDFYKEFNKEYHEENEGKSINEIDSKILFRQIFRLMQRRFYIDRSQAIDYFTGNFARPDCPGADDPVQIYKTKKGTSDGLVHLLTLLTNNSTFGLNCVPVSGQLVSGYPHEWNEFIDENGNILHYDLTIGMEGLTEDELSKVKERYIEEEYPWVNNNRPAEAITYVFKPGIGKKEEKNKSA
ncbi:MAG: hypothetical protein IKZ96_03300 [Bacilli bacterium]|nr:hypothetical protein [Bacilli bacterium]